MIIWEQECDPPESLLSVCTRLNMTEKDPFRHYIKKKARHNFITSGVLPKIAYHRQPLDPFKPLLTPKLTNLR